MTSGLPTPIHATAQNRAPHPPAGVPAPEPSREGLRDFDFLHGTWRIHNRRLRDPLTGSTEWYAFEGRSVERPLWDGQGNLEEYEATLPDGTCLRGLALRLYGPKAKRWTIHWSNSATGTLDPPMFGTFRDGVGTFYGHEDFQGRMILVRFLWTSASPEAARWEQAFSADGGRTWETNWIMEFTRTGGPEHPEHRRTADTAPAGTAGPRGADGAHCCPVVELRRYRLHPGQRDVLIDLFERELVETQEAAGMMLIAQFRDLDDPDVFTWLRGFRDMGARAASLGAFYGGPAWRAYRDAANATMVSSDDVRLLRPARPGSGIPLVERPGPGASTAPASLVAVTVYTLRAGSASGFARFFAREVEPLLVASGARPVAIFETEPSTNTFPRLPVREGEHAFVWLARFDDVAAHERFVAALAADPRWTGEVRPALARWLAAPVEVWRLAPTARSRAIR